MKKLIKKITPDFILKVFRSNKNLKAYKGNKVFCPVCKSSFSMFGAGGVILRDNARCHVCGSLERHRLLYKFLENKTNLFNSPQNLKLLHFAPEKPFYNNFSKKKNVEYTPCDLFPELFSYNGTVPVTKVDITEIPFEDNCFDVILCNHVLEHIPDDRKAMSELYRVMKKGGWGVFQVPIDYKREATYEDFSITEPKDREVAFGQKDHVRWYGQDYKDRLRSVGFNVTEDNYVKTFSKEELFKFGLMPNELIYYCTK